MNCEINTLGFSVFRLKTKREGTYGIGGYLLQCKNRLHYVYLINKLGMFVKTRSVYSINFHTREKLLETLKKSALNIEEEILVELLYASKLDFRLEPKRKIEYPFTTSPSMNSCTMALNTNELRLEEIYLYVFDFFIFPN